MRQEYPNFHGIIVKYLGPTDYRGSRVKMKSTRFGDSKTLSLDYEYNHVTEQAAAWLQARGQKIAGRVEIDSNTDMLLLEAIDGRFYSFYHLEQCKHGTPNVAMCAHCMREHEAKMLKK